MRHAFLTALPVYNEARHLAAVLTEVRRYSPEVLVVNDGSTDDTAEQLQSFPGIEVVHHPKNLGYGAALRSAFEFAIHKGVESLVTIDCDGQHQPKLIPVLAKALYPLGEPPYDIVSGSRYLTEFEGDSLPPEDRRRINQTVTAYLNEKLGFQLTDSFCGFKAYRVEALKKLKITENGYGMPLEVWVQAAQLGLRIREYPVPRIYLDEKRSFGGSLDDAQRRQRYYEQVLDQALARDAKTAHLRARFASGSSPASEPPRKPSPCG